MSAARSYGHAVPSQVTPPRARVAAALAVPLMIGIGLAAATLSTALGDARTQADAQVRAQVAQSVTLVRTEIRNQLSAAPAGGQRGDIQVPASDIGRGPMSLDAAITARDGGAATLDDTVKRASIVVPLYRGGRTPTSTAQRRVDSTGFLIVPLTLRPLLIQLDGTGSGLGVRGPSHDVATYPGAAPAHARSYAVDMDITGSPGWDVVAWKPDPGIPGFAWFWAGALLVLFAGIGGVLALLVRRNAAAADRIAALEHDRAVVTGLAPVLQASLDVGEVVPAVSSHLGASLMLRGLSLSTPHEGGERPLFIWGDTPDDSVPARVTRPERLEAGETVAVALTRGGRALGILRIVAGEPMTRDRLDSLTTAAELLGSTLANAEAYARQQDLLERMRSVDELKTVFLATASHELRTPVTAIVGFSTLLADQWGRMPEERARNLVERIKANGGRLDVLIEQLLDFSRLERGLPQTGDELLNLGATVQRILDDQPELTAQHRLEVDVTEDCLVRGSAAAIERVVTNLVGNAAKYSPPGKRITVTVRPENDQALLLVDDEGSGVPEADRGRIFSRFFRGRGDVVVRTRGAGIGLAIVAEYAASMSGTATVTDAPGGGARFCVSFPSVGTVSKAAVDKAARGGRLDVTIS